MNAVRPFGFVSEFQVAEETLSFSICAMVLHSDSYRLVELFVLITLWNEMCLCEWNSSDRKHESLNSMQ